MIETVNESVVKIEPKIVLAGEEIIALPAGTDLDTVINTGTYSLDSTQIIIVYNINGKVYQTIIAIDDDTYQIRVRESDIWETRDYLEKEVITNYLNEKVDKVAGKQLSTEDYTTAEKNKLAGLFSPAYASIYLDNGNTAQSIPTGATYTKVTAYTTNGQSANCTADAANDKITITQAGVYSITYTASYTADVNNVTFRGSVFLGGVEQGYIHSGGQMGLQGALRSTACSGFINVTSVPVDIDVRVRHDNVGSVNITHVYANLNVERIG